MLICSQVFNHIDSNTDGHLQFDEFVAALVPSASANSDTTSTYYSGAREFVYSLHTFNSAELTDAVNSLMPASPHPQKNQARQENRNNRKEHYRVQHG